MGFAPRALLPSAVRNPAGIQQVLRMGILDDLKLILSDEGQKNIKEYKERATDYFYGYRRSDQGSALVRRRSGCSGGAYETARQFKNSDMIVPLVRARLRGHGRRRRAPSPLPLIVWRV